MESKYEVRQISKPGKHAVHAYYDICPENFDGDHIVYSEFEEDRVPGPCKVVLCEKTGENKRYVGRNNDCLGHVGAFAQWHDRTSVSFLTEGGSGVTTAVYELEADQKQVFPGRMRQYCAALQRGFLLEAAPEAENPHQLINRVTIFDFTQQKALAVITTEMCRALIPRGVPKPPLEQLNFQNTKWSPDARSFFTVFGNEGYRKKNDAQETLKCLIAGDADGSDLRFVAAFGHHPMWTPDSSGFIAYMRKDKGQDLCLFTLGERVERTVMIPNALGVHATLHSDRRRVVTDIFRFPEPHQASIGIYDLETKALEIIATFNHKVYDHTHGFHPHPVWSRDGKRLYFNGQDNGYAQLYALLLD